MSQNSHLLLASDGEAQQLRIAHLQRPKTTQEPLDLIWNSMISMECSLWSWSCRTSRSSHLTWLSTPPLLKFREIYWYFCGLIEMSVKGYCTYCSLISSWNVFCVCVFDNNMLWKKRMYFIKEFQSVFFYYRLFFIIVLLLLIDIALGLSLFLSKIDPRKHVYLNRRSNLWGILACVILFPFFPIRFPV